MKSYLFVLQDMPWSPPLPSLVCVALAEVGYVEAAVYLFRGRAADLAASAGRAGPGTATSDDEPEPATARHDLIGKHE